VGCATRKSRNCAWPALRLSYKDTSQATLVSQCKYRLKVHHTACVHLVPELISEHTAAGLLRRDRELYNFNTTSKGRDRADYQYPDELEPDVIPFQGL